MLVVGSENVRAVQGIDGGEGGCLVAASKGAFMQRLVGGSHSISPAKATISAS
jgi:hypothetical protein